MGRCIKSKLIVTVLIYGVEGKETKARKGKKTVGGWRQRVGRWERKREVRNEGRTEQTCKGEDKGNNAAKLAQTNHSQ